MRRRVAPVAVDPVPAWCWAAFASTDDDTRTEARRWCLDHGWPWLQVLRWSHHHRAALAGHLEHGCDCPAHVGGRWHELEAGED